MCMCVFVPDVCVCLYFGCFRCQSYRDILLVLICPKDIIQQFMSLVVSKTVYYMKNL